MITKESLVKHDDGVVFLLIVLPENLSKYNDKLEYMEKARRIFKNNIESIDVMYYGENDSDEVLYEQLKDYMIKIRPYEYGFNFLFDPTNKFSNEELDYKLWECDIPNFMTIDIDME